MTRRGGASPAGGLSIRHTAVQVIFAGVDLPPAGQSALRCVPECCRCCDVTSMGLRFFFSSDVTMTAVTVLMLHCRELSSVGDHDIQFMEMRGGSFDDVFQRIRVSLQMRQQTVVGVSRV